MRTINMSTPLCMHRSVLQSTAYEFKSTHIIQGHAHLCSILIQNCVYRHGILIQECFHNHGFQKSVHRYDVVSSNDQTCTQAQLFRESWTDVIFAGDEKRERED